jgi:thiamine pyrophosphate-dependent acetolactate synthase large subunit-like protein
MTQEMGLRRREVVAKLVADRGDMLIVTGLGSPTYDCAAAGDHPLNFYLWGAMGSAVTVGLGLALAQPDRRVLVITGDGEMLMGLGALATIAVKKPRNLAIAIIDNEHYGETGMQPTHTGSGVDLAGMARTAGFAETATVVGTQTLEAGIRQLRGAPGPVFVAIKVAPGKDPLVLPPRDGPYLKTRFRQALLGTQAAV